VVENGSGTTALKALYRISELYRAFRFKVHGGSLEARFTAVYRNRQWGGGQPSENSSGPGSTLEYTKRLRAELPKLFQHFSIRSVFDAPCGDFNWMRYVLLECREISYVGADIVSPLVEANIAQHENDRVKFLHLDLTTANFPKADLMICRDCLFHLSYEDIKCILLGYVASGIPYLLTSTHIGNFKNCDFSSSGDFRLIDLFSEPFNFPKDVMYRIEDWTPPFPPREMCLWNRAQVISALRLPSTLALAGVGSRRVPIVRGPDDAIHPRDVS
jgi:hypothetical protein